MPMDQKFVGTWSFDASKSKGMEAFDKALCSSGHAGRAAQESTAGLDLKHSISIAQEGDRYKFVVDFKGVGEKLTHSMKEGETIDDPTPDGKNAKVTLTFESGNPVETFVIPNESKKYIIKFTVSGNVLTAVSTFGDASMTEVYNRA